jgi:YVTN family beta-propeller protein
VNSRLLLVSVGSLSVLCHTGCYKVTPSPDSVFISGGGFFTFYEPAAGTPSAPQLFGTSPAISTTSMTYWNESFPNPGVFDARLGPRCRCETLYWAAGSSVGYLQSRDFPVSLQQFAKMIPLGKNVDHVYTAGDGRGIYASHPDDGSISVIDGETQSFVRSIKTPGMKPTVMAQTNSTSLAQSSNLYFISGGNQIALIRSPEGANPTIVATASTGDGTGSLDADDTHVVVANTIQNLVYVFDPGLKLLGTVKVDSPNFVKIVQGKAYVSRLNGTDTGDFPGFVSIVDPGSLTVGTNIGVGVCPGEMAVAFFDTAAFVPPGSTNIGDLLLGGVLRTPQSLYVDNACEKTISKIDIATNKVVQTITVGTGPRTFAAYPLVYSPAYYQ